MENVIQTISHEKFGSLRAVVLNGTVYFVAKDAARSLGFKDTKKAINQHVQPQFRGGVLPPQNKGERIPHNAVLLNESGLYFIRLCRLPKKFNIG